MSSQSSHLTNPSGGELRDPWSPRPTTRGTLVAPPALIVLAVALLGSAGVGAQAGRETDSPAALLAVLATALGLSIALQVGRRRPLLAVATAVPALIAVAVVAIPLTGGRQFLIAVAATTVAFGAMTGWPAASWWRRAPSTRSTLAIGLLVATQVSWYHLAPQPVTIALLGSAALSVAVSARAPSMNSRVEHRVAAALQALATALAGLIVLVVAVPLVYLPAAIARLVRLVGRFGTPRPAWVPTPIPIRSPRRDAPLPFASTSSVDRRRRHLVGMSVTAAAIGLLAVTVGSGDSSTPPAGLRTAEASLPGEDRATELGEAPTPDRRLGLILPALAVPYSELAAFEGAPWADELQSLEVTDRDVRSEMFNVVDGERRTLAPPPCDGCPSATVWLSGGSAAFGIGQRDEHTVASELVRLAAADGITLHVRNLGRSGAFIFEEVEAIESKLTEGEPAPDLIVFLSGWNDVILNVLMRFAAEQNAEGLDPVEDFMGYVEFANDHSEQFLNAQFGSVEGRNAAERVREHRERLRRLVEPHGTDTAFFIQPDALVSTTQLGDYEDLTGIPSERLLNSPLAQASDGMVDALGGEATNLRDLFRSLRRQVFIGLIHQNEAGASMTATAMYEELKETVQAIAR